jgi:Erythromycin esterase homolog
MNQNDLMEKVSRTALAFSGPQDAREIIERAGEAKFVLLGEASHGTSDFYTHRAALSKRLIEEKGYRFVAVEGDWPSCYALNRYVKGHADSGSDAKDALKDFTRWPTWMWANREIAEFAEWLRSYNSGKPEEEKVGFFGIDLYSLWESMHELLHYLESKGGAQLEAAKRAFECFEPHGGDEQSYAVAASLYGEGCEDEVVDLLRQLQDKWRNASTDDREKKLNAELNALAVRGAEKYYRTMIRHDAESWNVRDRHMVDVLEKLMEFHGEDSRAIVWEHNTHIGDARATDMVDEGMVNVGQLLRERHGKEVYAVGFGTYEGTVIAGRSWGAPAQEMSVPSAMSGSWEELLHRIGPEDKLLLFPSNDPTVDEAVHGHRAIGVVYHPERERGNYVPTCLSKRYDAFIYLDRSKALSPLSEPVHA